MSNQFEQEKDNQGKTHEHVQPTNFDPVPPVNDELTIKVSVDKKKYILNADDIDIDFASATDRQRLQALERALEAQGEKVNLRGFEVHNINDQKWMVTPEAVFGK